MINSYLSISEEQKQQRKRQKELDDEEEEVEVEKAEPDLLSQTGASQTTGGRGASVFGQKDP